jgi:glycosyltransferase involved in cell wall biosynthesis
VNVWIINHFAVSPDQPGGTRHFMFARELVRRGLHASIVASSVSYSTRRESHLEANETASVEQHEGVTFIWLKTPSYGARWTARVWNMIVFAARLLTAPVLKQQSSPDVVIGSTPHLFSALAAWMLARSRRVPFVLEVRDLWPESLVALGRVSRWHPFILLLRSIEIFVYRRAAAILTLLPASHDYFVANGVRRERIHWLPNGVDISSIAPVSPPPAGRPFVVMYAGAHGLANGLDVILDAARDLRANSGAVEFRLVGEGPDKPRLVRRAAAESLANLRFEPPCPKQLVHSVLAQADAFLMVLARSPLFRWGISPNKLFDYMAAARPVIFAVSTPYNPVAEAEAGLTVEAGDAGAIAAAITALAEMSPERRWDMGKKGRAYVEEHFDISVLAERLLLVLNGVVRAART